MRNNITSNKQYLVYIRLKDNLQRLGIDVCMCVCVCLLLCVGASSTPWRKLAHWLLDILHWKNRSLSLVSFLVCYISNNYYYHILNSLSHSSLPPSLPPSLPLGVYVLCMARVGDTAGVVTSHYTSHHELPQCLVRM